MFYAAYNIRDNINLINDHEQSYEERKWSLANHLVNQSTMRTNISFHEKLRVKKMYRYIFFL